MEVSNFKKININDINQFGGVPVYYDFGSKKVLALHHNTLETTDLHLIAEAKDEEHADIFCDMLNLRKLNMNDMLFSEVYKLIKEVYKTSLMGRKPNYKLVYTEQDNSKDFGNLIAFSLN